MIETGNIIKNLSPTEAVVIDKIRKLGTKYSLSYTGVNSNKRASKILDEQQMESLEVLTSDGEFNFKGDPEKFVLYSEAERINSAYQFDPLFAINCSVVVWGIERSGFFNGREKWAKDFENQRV